MEKETEIDGKESKLSEKYGPEASTQTVTHLQPGDQIWWIEKDDKYLCIYCQVFSPHK